MKLKEICENITDGSHNPPSGIDSSEYLMLSSKNIFDDKITLEEPRYLSEEQFLAEDKRTCIKTGDVLMTIVGTVGRAAVVTADIPKITLQRSVAVLHPHCDVCNSRFLMYLLRSKKNFFEQEAHGVAQKGIYLKQLSEISVSIPTISQQEDIVGKLDRINKIIKSRQLELDKLDELIKARFVELFGEYYMKHINEKQLDEICDFIDYRGKTPEKSESGIPLITAKNVKDNRFSIEPQEFIPEENYDDVMTRGIPRVNDVLFTTEAPLGNVCRIPDVYERFCVGQRLITMQPHTDVINSEYLEHALASAEFQEKMWQKSSGSTVKGIRSKLLVLLTIPVPPIELQNQFAGFAHQVDKSKVVVQKALDEAQLLFDSLMQEYFG
jgi:type I restriction enzyme S subunit